MSNIYRDLNQTAIAYCKNKNELLVFIALMSQTLGYGKTSDPLTDKRLAQLTNIRLDRLRVALKSVVYNGLFDRKPHKQFGYEYTVGSDFLQAYPDKASLPFTPINRNLTAYKTPLTQMGNGLPDKQTHTVTNSYLKKPQQQTNTKKNKKIKNPPPQTKTKTNPIEHTEPQAVKLFFNNQNQVPQNFAIETTNANTRIEFSFGTQSEKTEIPIDIPVEINKPINTPITDTSPKPTVTHPVKTTTKLKKLMTAVKNKPTASETETTSSHPSTKQQKPWEEDALAIADELEKTEKNQASKEATQEKTPTTHPITPPVCGGDYKNKKEKTTPTTNILLPKIVGEENINACNRFFLPLDDQQKKDLLLVFNYNLKTRTVNNPAGYFITLAKTTAEEGLTIPPEAIVKAPPTAASIAAAKEKSHRMDRWSDFTWLQQNAALQNTDIAALATQMGEEMEEAYLMFADTLEEETSPAEQEQKNVQQANANDAASENLSLMQNML